MYQEGMKILGEESHSHASIQSKTFIQSWCSGSMNSYNNTSILVLYFCSKLPPIFFWITFVLKHSEKSCWELLHWSWQEPWWTSRFLLHFCSITSHFLLYTFYSETFRKILLRTLALKLTEPLVNSHVNFKQFQLEAFQEDWVGGHNQCQGNQNQRVLGVLISLFWTFLCFSQLPSWIQLISEK